MNISVAESIVSSWGGLHYSTIKIQGEFEASHFLVHAMPPTVGGAAEFVGAEKKSKPRRRASMGPTVHAMMTTWAIRKVGLLETWGKY